MCVYSSEDTVNCTSYVQRLGKMQTNLRGGHLDRQLDVKCFDDMFELVSKSE